MPSLVINFGSPEEREVEIREGVMTIGRATDCDIPVLDKSLSRRHAQLERSADVVMVRDLKSTNGTAVDGARIDCCRLYHGDKLKCGDVLIMFIEEPQVLQELALDRAGLSLEEIVGVETDRINTAAVSVLESPTAGGSREKLRILLKVSEILSSPEEIGSLLDRIVELLFKIMDVDRAVLLIADDAGGALVPRVVRSRGDGSLGAVTPAGPAPMAQPVAQPVARPSGAESEVERTVRMDGPVRPGPDDQEAAAPIYSRHIVNYVLAKNVAVISSDANSDARFKGAQSILAQSIRASMCAPLKTGEQTIGVLYVDNVSIADRFTGEDLEFLSAFANQAAIAIENSRLYKKIEQEAVYRNNFLRFFPPAVVPRIMASKDLGLGAIETEVTAIFCDICDFTNMSATMKPKDIVVLLNEYFPVMADVVFEHEGTLEKYIGDALLAVWGAPFTRADDVDRAVRAAIDMQRALIGLNERWAGKHELAIHIGLNTGKVAAGNIGSARYIQYATIGDTTNVASRICNVASASEIIVSDSTFRNVANVALPFEELPPVKVKGKDEPLLLHRLDWRAVPA